eukprot:CAMPEP_0175904314 /NCGR_PEP_ID=MMETSP0108-20121206/4403_1 /TAXON_ID=195067 ORGANISM="Goniomonas pacifica, Strain CCMP1869" /NCGR_SAMPLE_ID=MMETSP0108 /ASSEMBLY_ACC=CAM_ASM_000204 /LENGTH=35 /DNA_ID= /DNA_START= /DNA_END= /DNA_ORIENTATION=
MRLEASFATDVPAIPHEAERLAARKRGASHVSSPK